MQQATEQMRSGLDDFQSGIAGQKVVAEGTLPRNVALDWFRREMTPQWDPRFTRPEPPLVKAFPGDFENMKILLTPSIDEASLKKFLAIVNPNSHQKQPLGQNREDHLSGDLCN